MPSEIERVTSRLAEAGQTLLALKSFDCFPEAERSFWQRIASRTLSGQELSNRKCREPSAAEVQRMVEAWTWLKWLDKTAAKLVIARSLRHPSVHGPIFDWRTLANQFRLGAAPNAAACFIESVQTIGERLIVARRHAKRQAELAAAA